MHWTEVWEGNGLGPVLVRTALTPLSWVYSLGWRAYLATYQLHFKQSSEPHPGVLCVGNLQVGGTGKSPLVQYLVSVLIGMGTNVVLGCSGYGGQRSDGATLAPEGDLDAAEWGDEVAMHRWLSPSIPIVVGRNRVRAAELVAQASPGSILLMDDGFQHLPLKKHTSIVLDPPVYNRRCLPAGPYREPRSGLRRADLVLPGRFTLVDEPLELEDPISGTKHVPEGLRADALCAIGNPSRFFDALRALGVRVGKAHALPDHHPLDSGRLAPHLHGDVPVIVTAKDWVKLRTNPDLQKHRFLVARQSLSVQPFTEFRAWLEQNLDELK